METKYKLNKNNNNMENQYLMKKQRKNYKNKNTLLLHLSKKNSFVLILYNNFYYNL